ncbi:MAG: protein kinase [Caldilineaceae bacterium]|nr:protein kinase [Caldilineaceae bacterium]
MGSTANQSFDQQNQPEEMAQRELASGDGLLPQYFDGYRVVERLGGGAMATVYRAIDANTNQQVALKVLAPGADHVLRERFRVEARTVSTLEHPHIVRTLQVGQIQSGFPYIAMELVEGDSLATLLERQNQLSVVDSCLLLEPIARALAYAHSQHVVHRDVKPSNILLRHAQPNVEHSIKLSTMTTATIPLLSDFGIARALDAPELTSAGRTIGTPAYMSPEQCAGTRNLDGRADIYSLATVLYRCLVGRPPFMGATTQILHAHVYEALTIPEMIAQALPPAILTILQRALQKNPDDRYADMALFADDLATIVRYVQVPRNGGVTESTLTMPLLTALQAEQDKRTAHVLVGGIAEQSERAPNLGGRPATAASSEIGGRNPLTTARTTQPSSVASPPPKGRRGARQRSPNWFYVAVGSLVSLALIILAVSAIWGVLPSLASLIGNNDEPPTGTLLQTVTPDIAMQPATTGTPPLTTTLSIPATTSPSALANVLTPDAGQLALTLTPTTTIAGVATTLPPSATVTVTTTLTPEIAYDVGTIWREDVLFFYRDREWRETRRRFLEAFSIALQQAANVPFDQVLGMTPSEQATLIADTLLDDTAAPFWRQWQAAVSPDEARQVLFDIYVGIANEENSAARPEEALAYFDAALTLRNVPTIASLRRATATYAYAIGTPKLLAAQALSEVYQTTAAQFAESRDFCPAWEYITVANALNDTQALAETVLQYQQQCTNVQLIPLPQPVLVEPNGSIVYSTQEGGAYRIYQKAIGSADAEEPSLLIEAGAQPSFSPDGRYLAFYGTRNDALGLRLWDSNSGRNPSAIFPQLSANIEDSRYSPPSWAPDSSRVAFSSNREGDRIMRVYVTGAPAPGTTTTVDFGEDPAWTPPGSGQSLLVYKGTDRTGNNPGLWLASENGTKVRQLTSNGTDRRPVWSPDGQYMVFMRQLESGNWELFRVQVSDGSELQLTDHPAQDGLPTISPDGRWVAFATDRNGTWEIWRIALDGSSEQRLMPIQGVLHNWLEHAIQWVN